MSENKITLKAKLFLTEQAEHYNKECAARIPLPTENPQNDLLHMSAVLVSTGTNKNGATFLGSELVKAKNTIVDKALDIEHYPDKVVGHIKSAVYLDYEGNALDVNKMFSELGSADEQTQPQIVATLDEMNMDIGIICVVHKHRFKDLAKEIKEGEWHVSMECYFDDFDLKVGDIIIPKEQAATMNFDYPTNNLVKLVIAGHSLGNHRVSRVLRGIRFCGVGLVKNPANVRSIVDEAAGNVMISSDVPENLMNQYREAAGTLNINSDSGLPRMHLPEDTYKEVLVAAAESDMPKYIVVPSETINKEGSFAVEHANGEVHYVAHIRQAHLPSEEDATKLSIKATTQTGVKHYILEVGNKAEVNSVPQFSEEQFQDGFTLVKTTQEGEVVNLLETSNFAFIGKGGSDSKWGVGDNAAGLCASFTKYHYEFDRLPSPGKLMGVHWCKLFDKPCPVIGADATAKECLRHKYARLIKNDSIHFNATAPSPYNPKTTVPESDMEFIPAEDQPIPEEPVDKERYGERFMQGPADFDDSFEKPPVVDMSKPREGVPAPKDEDLTVTEKVTKHDPGIEEFMSILSEAANVVDKARSRILTAEERKLLKDSDFAYPSKKDLPIHNVEAVKGAMEILSRKIESETGKENGNPLNYLHPHARILKKAVIFGLDVDNFKDILNYEEGEDNFGVPRLGLLPLNSKPEIIAAISRFDKIKQDITDEERNILFVKIIKAASKHGINVESFVKKIRNNE